MAGEVLAIECGAKNMRRAQPKPHIRRVLAVGKEDIARWDPKKRPITKTEPLWYLQLDRAVVIGGICCFRGACEISKWIQERGWKNGELCDR